jgi:hypothetical protein
MTLVASELTPTVLKKSRRETVPGSSVPPWSFFAMRISVGEGEKREKYTTGVG